MNRFLQAALTAAVLLVAAVGAQGQSIVTVAGGGSDDGHAATDVALFGVAGLAFDSAGNLYLAEYYANLVRKIAPDGTISTVAGNSGAGFGGDGGRATKATLKHPSGIAVDSNGDIYIADHDNGRIRKVTAATGLISTIAGIGKDRTDGTIGDNGLATDAVLHGPYAIWLDRGNLYVTEDSYNGNRVRKIVLSTKIITTIAGAATGDSGYTGDGGPATAAQLTGPQGVAVDPAGNVFISDNFNHRVRRVDAVTGVIDTYFGGGDKQGDAAEGAAATAVKIQYPEALTFDSDGNLIVSELDRIWRVNKTTRTVATVTKEIGLSYGIALAKNGDLYIGDGFSFILRYTGTSTAGTTVAGGGTYVGDGLPAAAAVVRAPEGLAIDSAGNLYIADWGNALVRKVDAKTELISTFAGNGGYYDEGAENKPATQVPVGSPADLAFDPQGNLYIADQANQRVKRVDRTTGILTFYAGGGNPQGGNNEGLPATSAKLTDMVGISFDRIGNLYIAEQTVNKVWKVDAATHVITTFAGVGGDPGYTGDGGPATAAKLGYPNRAVADSAGNIYISDYYSNAVRKVTPDGIINTIAGGTDSSTFAPPFGDDGPARTAQLSPVHMAIDARNDDLYIADDYSSRIRKIDARTGIISTVVGSGTAYYVDADFTGDNGRAKDALLNFPFTYSGVAIDATGNLFVADTFNNRVRAVFACVSVVAPQLTAPSNGATNAPTAPLLSWNSVGGAFRYDVRLDTVSPPARVIASDVTETSFAPSNLSAGTKYFWSVTAKGDPFCPALSSAASAISSFITATGCGAGSFDIIAPAEGASNVNAAALTLSWNASPGAGSYDLYLGSTNPPALFRSGITQTSFATTTLDRTLFWFVVARAACDPTKSAATPIHAFSTNVSRTCGAAGTIILTSPSPGSSGVSTSIDLTWSVSGQETPDSFDLYFGTAANPPLLRGDLPRDTNSVSLPPLDLGTVYYWRVVGKGICFPSGTSTAVASFTTRTACTTPGATQIIFSPAAVSTGATYSIVWAVAPALDLDGGYLVERSTSPAFSPILDSQITSSTAASFVAGPTGTVYHRVRAVPACDPTRMGPLSDSKSVTITTAPSNIIFTVQPAAVVTALGEKIEDRRGTFTVENIGATAAQIIVGQSELPGSPPFFSIAEGGAFVTLKPRVPRTFNIQYSGPRNDTAASYQGVIFAVGVPQALAVTPYAFVNLKVGGGPAVAPQFVIDGTPSDYVAFPGFSGEDDNRPGREITIRNPGTAPMDLAAEIGPEIWLVPESGWNSQPLAAGASRTVKLLTRRLFAPSGSPLPRYTYFTLRTKDGSSARLLVQDNDLVSVGSGRATALDVSARSFIVPEAVSQTTGNGRAVSRLRLTNSGGDSVQVELLFTPTGADGFDANSVKRAVIVVPPNDVVTLTDPLIQIFGASDGALGQIEVRVPRERLGLITVTASTVFIGAGSTAIVPVVTRSQGARVAAPHVIYFPPAPSATINLTLAETSGLDKATVRVVTETGQTTTQDVPRYGMRRFSVGTASRLEIDVDGGGGSIIGLATITSGNRNATVLSRALNERIGTTALARAFWKTRPEATVPSITTVVPVISGSSSSGNAPSYKTAIGLVAQSAQAVFAASFYPSGGGVALNRSVTVAAGQTTVYSDVMKDLFAASTPSDGNLFLQGPPNGKVYAVLQTVSSSGSVAPASSLSLPTTLSEGLTSATSSAQRPLFLDGLEQSVDPSRGTRWMLLLNEVGGATGFVNVRLYEAGNRSRPIAEKDMAVGPNQQLKLDTVFKDLGLDASDRRKDRTNVELVVTATAGSARVAASAVSIDNVTGDTKMFALAPVVGSGNPNINFATPVVTEQPPPPSTTRRRSVKH